MIALTLILTSGAAQVYDQVWSVQGTADRLGAVCVDQVVVCVGGGGGEQFSPIIRLFAFRIQYPSRILSSRV